MWAKFNPFQVSHGNKDTCVGGTIDGIIGEQTIQAMNAFQRSRGLPVDRYLNIQTVRALGIRV